MTARLDHPELDHARLGHREAQANAPVAVHARGVDLPRATAAVTELLTALGADPDSPELAGTPQRAARMFADLVTPQAFHPTTFPNDAGYDELVLVSDIRFMSLCEQHLLPFRGVAHVGYLPGEHLIGLSKLARLVDVAATRLQRQERLTTQIADWIHDHLAPRGVGVVVEAEHGCTSIPGGDGDGARCVTSTLHGLLRDRPAARQEFLQLARDRAGHRP